MCTIYRVFADLRACARHVGAPSVHSQTGMGLPRGTQRVTVGVPDNRHRVRTKTLHCGRPRLRVLSRPTAKRKNVQREREPQPPQAPTGSTSFHGLVSSFATTWGRPKLLPSHELIPARGGTKGSSHCRIGRPNLRLDQGPRRPPDRWLIASLSATERQRMTLRRSSSRVWQHTNTPPLPHTAQWEDAAHMCPHGKHDVAHDRSTALICAQEGPA